MMCAWSPTVCDPKVPVTKGLPLSLSPTCLGVFSAPESHGPQPRWALQGLVWLHSCITTVWGNKSTGDLGRGSQAPWLGSPSPPHPCPARALGFKLGAAFPSFPPGLALQEPCSELAAGVASRFPTGPHVGLCLSRAMGRWLGALCG